jgi:hypothetical protein
MRIERRAMTDLERQFPTLSPAVLAALCEVLIPENVPGWLVTPNPNLGGLTPLENVEARGEEMLWDMIHAVNYGLF